MKCTSCGAANSLAAIRAGHCEYCRTAFPEAVRRAQAEAALALLMEDRDGDGIPDGLAALESLQAAQRKRDEARKVAEERASEDASLRRSLTELRKPFAWARAVLSYAGILALLCSIPYHLTFVRWLERDPWFGFHHEIFCSSVCEGCTGPYRIFAWIPYSTPTEQSPESTVVYCHPTPDHFSGYAESQFLGNLKKNSPYELPGATYTLWFSSLALMFVMILPIGGLLARATYRARKARALLISQTLASREEQ